MQNRFQWVHLQVKQILDLETEEAVRDRLGKLPSGLKATYDEIYGKVKARNKHDRAVADRALRWVMCACTPLSNEELLSAIRLDPEKDTICLSDKITESQLLTAMTSDQDSHCALASVNSYVIESCWSRR